MDFAVLGRMESILNRFRMDLIWFCLDFWICSIKLWPLEFIPSLGSVASSNQSRSALIRPIAPQPIFGKIIEGPMLEDVLVTSWSIWKTRDILKSGDWDSGEDLCSYERTKDLFVLQLQFFIFFDSFDFDSSEKFW